MTIKTVYNIGDTIFSENWGARKIVSVHLYESEKKHTERYYLGNGEWVTIVRNKKIIKTRGKK